MTDLDGVDEGLEEGETELVSPADEETEPLFNPISQEGAGREELLRVLGDIITLAGHKAARGRYKNPAAEQLRIRYLTLVKDTCTAYNAVMKDQELDDMSSLITSLEGARHEVR